MIFILFFLIAFVVAHQRYEVDVFKETVLLGNDALMKCSIPSHVSDYLSVVGWVDSDGTEHIEQKGIKCGLFISC